MAGQTAIPPAAVGTLRGGAAAGVVVAVLSLITALTSLDWGPKYGPLAATIAGLVPAIYGIMDQLGGQPGQSSMLAGKDVPPTPNLGLVGSEPIAVTLEPVAMQASPPLDPGVWGEAVAEAILRTIDKLAATPPPQGQT